MEIGQFMNETIAQTDAAKLNPRIRKMLIGVKELKEITFYPFSRAVQTQMKTMLEEMFVTVLNAMGTADNIRVSEDLNKASKDYLLAKTIIDTGLEQLMKNFAQVLTLSTCEEHKGDELLDDMDNEQIVEAAETILDMNFAGAIKKVPPAIAKWKSVFADLLPAKTAAQEPSALTSA